MGRPKQKYVKIHAPSFRINEELHRKLLALAKKNNFSLSKWLREAVEQRFCDEFPQHYLEIRGELDGF